MSGETPAHPKQVLVSKPKTLYVRRGSSTVPLDLQEAIAYIHEHWTGVFLDRLLDRISAFRLQHRTPVAVSGVDSGD